MYSGVKSAFLDTFGDAITATCGESGVDFVHQLEKVLTQYVCEREEPFTVVHGDFRLDNMLLHLPKVERNALLLIGKLLGTVTASQILHISLEQVLCCKIDGHMSNNSWIATLPDCNHKV